MKAVDSNTACPKLVKWMAIVAALVGVACFGLYLLQVFNGEGVRLFLYISAFLLIYGAMFYGEYLLLTITVDEEKDTITDSRHKKYPLKVSQIKTATYKVNRKGKYRSLFLHDTGVGFMDIRTSKENAHLIVNQIRKVNPAVEINTANYL